jgi:hypothetical protein
MYNVQYMPKCASKKKESFADITDNNYGRDDSNNRETTF